VFRSIDGGMNLGVRTLGCSVLAPFDEPLPFITKVIPRRHCCLLCRRDLYFKDDQISHLICFGNSSKVACPLMGNCLSGSSSPHDGVGRRLDLSSKNLCMLPESVGFDLSITSLDLSYNNILKFPKRMARFTSLRHLIMRSNSLKKFVE